MVCFVHGVCRGAKLQLPAISYQLMAHSSHDGGSREIGRAEEAVVGVARPTDYAGTMRRIRPRGVQRGEAPLRFSLSPFAKGGSRGIGLGEEARVGAAHLTDCRFAAHA